MDGVTAATQATNDRSWKRWLTFLERIHMDSDPFLNTASSASERHILLGAFAHAIRIGELSRPVRGRDTVGADTCRTALESVAKIFTVHGRHDPRFDADGRIAFLIQRQLRGYQNLDPGVRHEKPLAVELIRRMVQRPTFNVAALRHFHWLVVFGLLCHAELRIPPSIEERERPPDAPPPLRNPTFLKDHRILDHTCDRLDLADTIISVPFEWLKRDGRDDRITLGRTQHPVLCPVKAGADIVTYLRSIGGTNDTPLYTYRHEYHHDLRPLTAFQARELLRHFVASIPEAEGWGLRPDEVAGPTFVPIVRRHGHVPERGADADVMLTANISCP